MRKKDKKILLMHSDDIESFVKWATINYVWVKEIELFQSKKYPKIFKTYKILMQEFANQL